MKILVWVLLVGLSVFVTTWSVIVTPDGPAPVELADGGQRVIAVLSITDVHGRRTSCSMPRHLRGA